jgi:hypothetical protein
MTHKIIKTDGYLLVVDDSEIKVGDFCYDEEADPGHNNQKGVTKCLRTASDSYWNKHCKKIVYHLPLNNSPILEGVPLLPPLEDELEKLEMEYFIELEKRREVAKNFTGQVAGRHPDAFGHSEIMHMNRGYIEGYNKAKEKYKYTEEDLIKCWNASRDYTIVLRESNDIGKGLQYPDREKFIQSLQQPKMPVGFECEEIIVCTNCGQNDCDRLGCRGHEDIKIIETITNPQGITQLVGTYKYE